MTELKFIYLFITFFLVMLCPKTWGCSESKTGETYLILIIWKRGSVGEDEGALSSNLLHGVAVAFFSRLHQSLFVDFTIYFNLIVPLCKSFLYLQRAIIILQL